MSLLMVVFCFIFGRLLYSGWTFGFSRGGFLSTCHVGRTFHMYSGIGKLSWLTSGM